MKDDKIKFYRNNYVESTKPVCMLFGVDDKLFEKIVKSSSKDNGSYVLANNELDIMETISKRCRTAAFRHLYNSEDKTLLFVRSYFSLTNDTIGAVWRLGRTSGVRLIVLSEDVDDSVNCSELDWVIRYNSNALTDETSAKLNSIKEFRERLNVTNTELFNREQRKLAHGRV